MMKALFWNIKIFMSLIWRRFDNVEPTVRYSPGLAWTIGRILSGRDKELEQRQREFKARIMDA